ncbi:MAG: serine/threonine-protein kinase [Pseudomonadota bacterium]
MLDWAKITSNLEHALTLDTESAAEFLKSSIVDLETRVLVQSLLDRSRPKQAFMQTSAPEAVSPKPAEQLQSKARIDHWEIEEHIGKGGMGEVYRARRADGLYEQTVALKLIHGTSAPRIKRFQQERQRLARLQHPNIARIVDGGTSADGRAYLVMEFVQGTTIDAYVEANELENKDKLELFRSLCGAVSHAHSQLILHRDIKPENVLVDAQGQVRLIDFGIASGLDEDEAEMMALTVSSAAPEQLEGRLETVQTDIFALGIMLHRLCAGVFPERLSNGGMAPLAQYIQNKDLLAILARCLCAAPDDRYASVNALADDITALLETRPVSARNGGQLYRFQKGLSRFPLASALAGVAALALIGGTIVSLNFATSAQAEAERANAALDQMQWEYGRAEANLDAQQAYSEIMQLAFGGEEDVERVSQLMIDRRDELFENRAQNPNGAAAASYAIGRNFYFRGDTRRALEIFDPWMKEGFGSEPLIGIGEELYALMLADAGRNEEAEPLLRKLVAEFDNGYRSGEADLFNYSAKLARVTKAEADINRAEELVLALIEKDTEPFETLFHYNHLGFLRMAKSDRPGAYQAFVKTVEIFEANPDLAPYGQDIARYNLAGQELGFRRDLDRAEAIIDSVLTEDVPLKGLSLQAGRAYLVKGLIQAERGANDEAQGTLEQSIGLLEQFGGAGSPPHLIGLSAWICIDARAGRIEQAEARLEDANSRLPDKRDDPKLAMARVYVDLAKGGSSTSVEDRLSDSSMQTSVKGDAIQYYLYRLLVEDGLAPDLDKAALD